MDRKVCLLRFVARLASTEEIGIQLKRMETKSAVQGRRRSILSMSKRYLTYDILSLHATHGGNVRNVMSEAGVTGSYKELHSKDTVGCNYMPLLDTCF